MELSKALDISASGMDAQTVRLRVIAENLANQDTTSVGPNGKPYRRKTVTFENKLDQETGVGLVHVKQIGTDNSNADANGYVDMPNVNSLVELMDMREAERAYDANVSVLQATRGMLARTIALLK
jgi:flagellar basal-body rod protein FlgC